jgi:hypothetical protein
MTQNSARTDFLAAKGDGRGLQRAARGLLRPVEEDIGSASLPFVRIAAEAYIGSMPQAIRYTYRVDREKADGFRWVIFKRYREISRSRTVFATLLEAQADAKQTILLFTQPKPP